MVLDLYHGSENIIEHPVFGQGKTTNDYGRGFYCTESIDLAKEWACGQNQNGYANHYRINTDGLTVLNLNAPEYSILNWLAVLTKNRTYWQNGSIAAEAKQYLQEHFYIDTTKHDLVIGYRADDSYFSFAQSFISNAISYRKLSAAMKLGKLGEQVMLQSEVAFAKLQFVDAEQAEAATYFPKKDQRDKAARKEFRKQRADAETVNDLFMLDIMREEIANDDPRLR